MKGTGVITIPAKIATKNPKEGPNPSLVNKSSAEDSPPKLPPKAIQFIHPAVNIAAEIPHRTMAPL
jgi:hypothetical protein